MNVHVADPCTKNRSLADVLAAVLGRRSLKETRRRDLASALRTTARLLNRELAEIPADMTHLRARLDAIHPVQARIKPKRLANLKSDLAAALRLVLQRTRRHSRVHRNAAWETFMASLEQPWQRYTLSRLATFCSLRKIEPPAVDDRVMAMFRAHLGEASLAKAPAKTCKCTIQTWNGNIERKGLPLQRLTSPASTQYRTPPLSDYPNSFQADVEQWIRRNTEVDLLSDDGPPRPARPQTLRNHRHNIRQFAAAVVARGAPEESITSLANLVELENFKEGVRFFIARNDGAVPSWLWGMAGILLAIAKYHVEVPVNDLEKLRNVKAQIKVYRPGMTEKNTHRLAQFDDLRNVERLMTLPRTLSERADESSEKSSWVALAVMHAVAIEILLACPMRVGNLAMLNIERHFIWRGQGNAQIIALVIPGTECPSSGISGQMAS